MGQTCGYKTLKVSLGYAKVKQTNLKMGGGRERIFQTRAATGMNFDSFLTRIECGKLFPRQHKTLAEKVIYLLPTLYFKLETHTNIELTIEESA